MRKEDELGRFWAVSCPGLRDILPSQRTARISLKCSLPS